MRESGHLKLTDIGAYMMQFNFLKLICGRCERAFYLLEPLIDDTIGQKKTHLG